TPSRSPRRCATTSASSCAGRSSRAGRWTSCWPWPAARTSSSPPCSSSSRAGPACRRSRKRCDPGRRGRVTTQPFPYLLLPTLWAVRNRARRREHGDGTRIAIFGGLAVVVGAAIFGIVFWLTWQLYDYAELGDYLIRLGFSWLFLTFLSFLAFSGVVTSLSTFFLSEDLR